MKSADRSYDRHIWKNWHLIVVYWFAVGLGSCLLWTSGVAAHLFQLEIMIPSAVGLLGLFIALWLANRERNKKITENHFYKLQILWHVCRMLDNVGAHFGQWENIDQSKPQDASNESNDEVIQEMRQASVSEYYYHKNQIEMLNVNTYVPADVRHCVLLLLRTAGISLWWYHPRAQTESNIRTVTVKLLNPLDQLISSEYFTEERDGEVRKWLKKVDSIRYQIRELVDSWGSSHDNSLWFKQSKD